MIELLITLCIISMVFTANINLLLQSMHMYNSLESLMYTSIELETVSELQDYV